MLLDVNEAAVAKGVDGIAKNLQKLVAKKKLSEADASATLSRIKPSLDYSDLANVVKIEENLVDD